MELRQTIKSKHTIMVNPKQCRSQLNYKVKQNKAEIL